MHDVIEKYRQFPNALFRRSKILHVLYLLLTDTLRGEKVLLHRLKLPKIILGNHQILTIFSNINYILIKLKHYSKLWNESISKSIFAQN